MRFISVSYTIDPLTDSIILVSGTAANITLPLPTAVLVGTVFRITNIGAAACNVISAGGANVNGVGSYAQAQYVSKEWITKGSQWFG